MCLCWYQFASCRLISGKVSIIKYMLRCANNTSVSRTVALPPTERVIFLQLVQGDDASGNTPIHWCCEMLARHDVVQRGNKYMRCLDQLLYFITARQQDPLSGEVFIISCHSSFSIVNHEVDSIDFCRISKALWFWIISRYSRHFFFKLHCIWRLEMEGQHFTFSISFSSR